MSTRKQIKAKQNLFKQIVPFSITFLKRVIKWFLRSLLVISRRTRKQHRLSQSSGFVLPTVAMVLLVIVLLSAALIFRSFDRSQYASSVRVNELVLDAAMPALDRAKAKIDALFSDPTLPRATPSDIALYNAFSSSRYNFGDETRLKLVSDINGNGTIEKQPATSLENDETINTAWKYPVDTDNNGKFDSYTLYGIYFRSPTRGTDGKFNRARKPLEARTPPMSGGLLGRQCSNATTGSSSLVGDSSWFRNGTKLSKSFFVFTATVPITTDPNRDNYEKYTGNKGFSALEYEQDRSQIPLSNNAVLFQNDLELSPGSTFRLNGRVATNSNLLMGGHGGAITLYQVSSKNSCFYTQENAKITVGGNVGTGNINDTTDQTAVTVHLYNGVGNDPNSATIDGSSRSTNSAGGAQVGYNDAAYNRRIALMKQTALAYHPGYNSTTQLISPSPTINSVNGVSQYPQEVKDGFKVKIQAPGGSSLNSQDVLAEQLEVYLKDRTRRIPYAEVSTPDGNALGTYNSTNVFASGIIEPPTAWREPIDANTGLSLNTSNLAQTQPEKQKQLGKEQYLGDRINVGNNLPAYWKNSSGNYVTGQFERQPLASSVYWTDPNTQNRYRTTQVVALPDLGISDRNGFWEDSAAQQPASANSNVGGLRIVTGAGIYDDRSATVGIPPFPSFTNSFLREPKLDSGTTAPPVFTTNLITSGNDNIVTWSDLMPMTGGADEVAGSNRKGDLQMRATAFYHYTDSSYTDSNYINRTPTVCLSSYYDPSNATTASNINSLPWNAAAGGRSNNGIVYRTPYTNDVGRTAAVTFYRTWLNRQARLIFPNGRIVNAPLRAALQKIDANGTRSLADNSAIDTAICALKILDGTLTIDNSKLAHGAIQESSFLDGREIKAIDTANGSDPISPNELASPSYSTSSNYNLPLEQRQPLEIRVTDINMNALRTTTIGGATNQEYLLPNSGIIYATRDDALPDLSDTSANKELLSPTDFKLDPTRRPNGIRLINGSNLARQNTYRQEEKGLILVTNLPAYIRGDFNLHQKPGGGAFTEEFMEKLDNTWGNFYSRNNPLDTDFACRIGQPGCGSSGDQWRPATVIADSMSLLSASFIDGFRNQGDYDLNNNAGSSATQSRLRNGFFENSFVPSALWWNTSNTGNTPYPSGKTTNSYVSSYLTNGVGSIQRRTNFPEYVMEVCTKLPVSACGPNDWYVNPATNLKASDVIGQTFSITTHRAGTTAIAADSSYQRYARRVAFKRRNSSTIVLTPWSSPNDSQATPIPLGINSSGQIAEFPYTSSDVPRATNNALWFRTTNNTNGRPFCNGNNDPASSGCTSNDRTYVANKPLYYDGTTRLTSPPTPEIVGVPSLNLPLGNPTSGYTICTDKNAGSTKKFLIDAPGDVDLDKCSSQPGNPMAQVDAVRDFLTDPTKFGPDLSTTDNIVRPVRSGDSPTATFPKDTAGKNTIFTSTPAAPTEQVVNVIDLSGDFNTNSTCTIVKLVGNANSIFVFRQSANSELSFGERGSDCGVQVVLDGVDPNNVIWAINANVKWNEVSSTPPAKRHKMAGTFLIDNTGSPKWNTVDFDDGGRILGPNGVPSRSNFQNSTIKAIASNGQPFLVPVLQIHSPGGSPGNALDSGGSITNSWVQQAGTDTRFNAAFVIGNSPSRPAEESAGLHNFVRFMEKWSSTVNIRGSFIQLIRSAYSTGPFSPIRSTGSAPTANPSASNDGSLSIFGYSNTYYPSGGGPGNTLTYYGAPTRQWGFDVALLSQSPDLFAQKFTQSAATPDEFFREIGRDDTWIQTLLCAAQGSDRNYTYAVDDSERPNCQFNPFNTSAYSD